MEMLSILFYNLDNVICLSNARVTQKKRDNVAEEETTAGKMNFSEHVLLLTVAHSFVVFELCCKSL